MGPYSAVSLAQARDAATDARRLVEQGIDPIKAREQAVSVTRVPTFASAAAAYIRAHRRGWVRKWARTWVSTLRRFAKPIRAMPVDQITTEDALQVLRPIWMDKTRTANEVRQRCEAILVTVLCAQLGGRAVAWSEEEIQAWVASRLAARKSA